MSIERIDKELCTGCGMCVNSCVVDCIRMDKDAKKAVIAYPEDCMICYLCAQDCPVKAITVSPVKFSPLITAWG